jgi:hypothetical protein
MFRPMTAIFSRAGLLGLLLLLAGCGEREPAVITPPKEAAAVIEPFLKELRAGNREKAKSFVSTAAYDELEAQFSADQKRLASAPVLTPRFTSETRRNFEAMGETLEPDGHEITMVYAAKQKDKWTSATVRMYRYRDEPYKVEYWRVTDKAPTPVLNSGVAEKMQETQNNMRWMFGGMAVFGLLGLALLIWLVKRKPHLIAPDAPAEVRRSAATVRDEV